MSAYTDLRAALRRHNGIATQWQVRHELTKYLSQFSVQAKDPFTHKLIDWNDLYSRSEWFAQVNSKKKARRKKEYDTVGGERLAIQEHAPDLDDTHDNDLDWIDNYAAKQRREIEDDSYHAEW